MPQFGFRADTESTAAPELGDGALGAALPVAPDYGRGTLNMVVPTLDAALAEWHGVAPVCSGPGTGVDAAELIPGLEPARRAVMVMVDGLGSELIERYGGHAPVIRQAMQRKNSQVLSTVFPTTTAAALTAMGTGLAPAEHGIVGYDAVAPDPAGGRRMVNQLGNWPSDLEPREWQPNPTCFERMEAVRRVVTVSRDKFEDSALTRSSLRGGEFVGVTTPHARVGATLTELKHKDVFVYLYWDDLDKAGHAHGVASKQWLHELEELDAAMGRLVAKLPPDTAVVLTADHGMVDIPREGRIDYSQFPELIDGVELTAGEPRAVQLHFAADAPQSQRDAVVAAWKERFGSDAWILTREEYVELGWFGAVFRDGVLERAGDVVIAAHGPIALYDGRRVSPHAFEMIGQHGSLTEAERRIPFAVLAQS